MYVIPSVQFTTPHFSHRMCTYIFSMTDVSQSGSTMYFISSLQFTSHFSHRLCPYIFSMTDVSQSGSTMHFISSVQFTSPHFSHRPTYSQCLTFPSPVIQCTSYAQFNSRLLISLLQVTTAFSKYIHCDLVHISGVDSRLQQAQIYYWRQ